MYLCPSRQMYVPIPLGRGAIAEGVVVLPITLVSLGKLGVPGSCLQLLVPELLFSVFISSTNHLATSSGRCSSLGTETEGTLPVFPLCLKLVSVSFPWRY